MRKILFIIFSLLACACGMSSCHDEIEHVSERTMENILYEFHLAQYAPEQFDKPYDKRQFDKNVYINAIFRKYGVTRAEFDSSMVYYCRHSDELQKIYEKVNERLNNEAITVGGSATVVNDNMTYSTTGDTANIWLYDKFMVLTNYVPFNKFSFTMPADTSFHVGDHFFLQFDQKFLYQDGYKRGTVLLAVNYDNDSTTYQVQNFSIDGKTMLNIFSAKDLKIKALSGFIMLNNNSFESSSTTLKLLMLENIVLLRMREKQNNEEKDSEITDNKPDSTKQLTIGN